MVNLQGNPSSLFFKSAERRTRIEEQLCLSRKLKKEAVERLLGSSDSNKKNEDGRMERDKENMGIEVPIVSIFSIPNEKRQDENEPELVLEQPNKAEHERRQDEQESSDLEMPSLPCVTSSLTFDSYERSDHESTDDGTRGEFAMLYGQQSQDVAKADDHSVRTIDVLFGLLTCNPVDKSSIHDWNRWY
mmetsp:Transcript_19457/g.34238  ORF Transcript_19457/g.34238 Transcript_19457/m.34238 type:complete len:189 (-) Transcript_19457:77-643(-)